MGSELYERPRPSRRHCDRALRRARPAPRAPAARGPLRRARRPRPRCSTTPATPSRRSSRSRSRCIGLLAVFGLEPDLLTGHSVGEIAAAHLAGVFSLADAAKLVARPGQPDGRACRQGGAMAGDRGERGGGRPRRSPARRSWPIAAVNGPDARRRSPARRRRSTSSRPSWREQGRKTKRLAVSHAFHSPLMEPMLEAFGEVACILTFREPRIPRRLRPHRRAAHGGAGDRSRLLGRATRASRCASPTPSTTLQAHGVTAYLELGPDAVLCRDGREPPRRRRERPPSSRPCARDGGEPERSLAALAAAARGGRRVEWSCLLRRHGRQVRSAADLSLPAQALTGSAGAGARIPARSAQAAANHPLLGAAIEDPRAAASLLTGRLSLQTHPWLADHVVGGHRPAARHGLRRAGAGGGDEVGWRRRRRGADPPGRRWSCRRAAACRSRSRSRGPTTTGGGGSSIHSPSPEPAKRSRGWTCNAERALSAERARRCRSRSDPGPRRGPSRSTSMTSTTGWPRPASTMAPRSRG